MKAYEIVTAGGPGEWKQVERPEPTPGPGQALVRIRAVSLNYRDLLLVSGRYPQPITRPILPLSDGAGEVVAVGEGVTRVKVGDRVIPTFFQTLTDGTVSMAEGGTKALGGGDRDGVLAELVVLDAEGLVHLPEQMSFEEGATLPCAAVTAWNALVPQGGLVAGQTVLAQGTGGVSIFALQFAHALGAKVIITSSQDEKLAKAKALGADGTINYRKHPDWEKAVLELTGGEGVDHVIEVGGVETLPRAITATRAGGHLALIGLLSGSFGAPDPAAVEVKKLKVELVFVGSRVMFEAMNQVITTHGIRPVIDRVFPFEQAVEALRYLESGAHFGKIVITV
ncbi:zinc-dependent alcohol dehydrogenase family protein [Chondromyces crocatus]|uniref:NADPH:quinone oxidoreductase n=1 Tax=Chondromyces crocatus TaxID=52 RepID=A0A0K1EBU4_CHOCO|nr:NAD(P)-dependent alcohol dehydrogenase [Chondromyces crocatus]AKT38142.1 NADPH:quinone oxidoreductase [Chondromyces crocatus]